MKKLILLLVSIPLISFGQKNIIDGKANPKNGFIISYLLIRVERNAVDVAI